MVKYYPPFDRLFHTLGDPTRCRIVERLAEGPATVSQLAAPLPMSLPAVLRHLRLLEDSGLVRSEKSGRVRICRLDPVSIRAAEQWLADRRGAWEHHLDRLGTAPESANTPITTADAPSSSNSHEGTPP